ncbi:NAD(P)-binding protein [Irpex lacteus]|nr:NAD(P)-binding protein [Irpex lacteus]
MSQTTILFLGATGYLGGSVLARLLAHPSRHTFAITALVRSEEKAKKLETFGVTPVVGSTKDTALLAKLAENAHVVFSTADSDDLEATTAFLTGIKNRHVKTGDVPILIHTSGTGVLTAGEAFTKGLGITDKIFVDDDSDDLERSIPSTAWHRNVDLAIIQADKEGYVRSHIVAPGVIWGIAKHALVKAGISNANTKGVGFIALPSVARGQAAVIGKGQAIWPSVNIEEQADVFIILYDAIVSSPEKVGHGRDGYYFGENGEFLWYDLSKAIGKALVKRGLAQTDEPTSFTSEELIKNFGSEDVGNMFGSNSRARGKKARSLGWEPKLDTQSFLDSIDAEVEILLKQK